MKEGEPGQTPPLLNLPRCSIVLRASVIFFVLGILTNNLDAGKTAGRRR
jgi:hypothetical protein